MGKFLVCPLHSLLWPFLHGSCDVVIALLLPSFCKRQNEGRREGSKNLLNIENRNMKFFKLFDKFYNMCYWRLSDTDNSFFLKFSSKNVGDCSS